MKVRQLLFGLMHQLTQKSASIQKRDYTQKQLTQSASIRV